MIWIAHKAQRAGIRNGDKAEALPDPAHVAQCLAVDIEGVGNRRGHAGVKELIATADGIAGQAEAHVIRLPHHRGERLRDRSRTAAIQVEAVAAGGRRPIGVDQVNRAADGPTVQTGADGFETAAEAAGGLEPAVVNQLDRSMRGGGEKSEHCDGGVGLDSGHFIPLL